MISDLVLYQLLRRIKRRSDSVTTLLGITEQHLCVGRVEHWVWNISISTTHASLHDNDLLALVGVNNRHTCDRARRKLSARPSIHTVLESLTCPFAVQLG